jgi:type II secretory pathway pseudopilin PulG
MRSPNFTRAFTLLELLVAAVITLLLAGVMLAVTNGTLALWHRTQDSFGSATQAKVALDLLERDLQAGVFRSDGTKAWLAIDVLNSAGDLLNHGWEAAPLTKPATAESQRLLPDSAGGLDPVLTDARFGLSGAWLRFITTNVETGGSLPTAVAYQIARRPVSGPNNSPTNPAQVRYTLFRSAVAADTTFAAGCDVLSAAYGSVSSAPSVARSAPTLTNPPPSDALAVNVVDFGVWLYVRDSSGTLRLIYPADNSDLSHAARDAGSAPDANRYPEVAEVMLRTLTDEGARLIDAMEQGTGAITRPVEYSNDAEWWWAVVEANSRVYTRRVEIKGPVR